MIKPDVDSAQVRVPPPLVFLATVIAICVLGSIVKKEFSSSEIRWSVGCILAAVSLGTVFFCVSFFKNEGTAIPPWMPTEKILVEGPYRFSRNPIYLSMLLFNVGVVFMVNNLYGFFLLIPLYLFLSRYVIAREEAYLSKKFGSEYQAYLDSTRRWL